MSPYWLGFLLGFAFSFLVSFLFVLLLASALRMRERGERGE